MPVSCIQGPVAPSLQTQTVIVRGKHVAEIRVGFLSPAEIGEVDAKVIDLRTGFLMAGLIDTHVHLTTERSTSADTVAATITDVELAIIAATNAERMMRAGFTTVMDMGNGLRNDELAIVAVRDMIDEGQLPGPEILFSGSPLSIIGFSRHSRLRDEVEAVLGPGGVCDGADACRGMVREQVARGADFVNVYTTGSLLSEPSLGRTFSDAKLSAISAKAAALGKVVVSDGGNSVSDTIAPHSVVGGYQTELAIRGLAHFS